MDQVSSSIATAGLYAWGTLLGVVIAVPTGAQPSPSAYRSGPEARAREAALAAPMNAFGRSADAMIQFFGRPLSFEVERREALHNELPDEHLWLRFEQADAHLVVSLQYARNHLDELTVRGSEPLGRLDLPFELTAEDVERTLGAPDGVDGEVHRFELCPDVGCSRLLVTIRDGAVAAIEWDWWWD